MPDPVLGEVELRWPGVSLVRCKLAEGTPAEAAGGLLDLALGPDPDPGFYSELVLCGQVVPWKALG